MAIPPRTESSQTERLAESIEYRVTSASRDLMERSLSQVESLKRSLRLLLAALATLVVIKLVVSVATFLELRAEIEVVKQALERSSRLPARGSAAPTGL